jgi:hypothetical protein
LKYIHSVSFEVLVISVTEVETTYYLHVLCQLHPTPGKGFSTIFTSGCRVSSSHLVKELHVDLAQIYAVSGHAEENPAREILVPPVGATTELYKTLDK